MKTLFTRSILSVLVLVALVSPAAAQTALNETTLSATITASQSTLVVASATGFSAGKVIYIEREAMRVSAVSSTTITVVRGFGPTVPTAHAVSAVVYAGDSAAFTPGPGKAGSCTATAERYLPVINTQNGAVYDCGNAGVWFDRRNTRLVTCRALLIADMIDQMCFTADQAYIVTKITYVATTAEAGGTLTVIPRKTTSTTAPASGTALATAIDAVTTGTAAQVVATATLTSTASALKLAAGNRLALDFTDDTAGELAGVEVTFTLAPIN